MPEEKKELTMQEVAARFRQHFNDQMAKQVNEYDGTKLAQEIIATLNKDRHMVIWKLLGLDNSWGRLEVDHCNGRNSPIVEMMTEAVQAEVKEWLNEAIHEVIAANRPKLKAQFRSAFKKEFEDRANWYTRDHARESAQEVLAEIRKEVEKEFKEGVRNASVEEAERKSDPGQADPA
jgi:lipoate-protein ligase A